MDRTEDVLGLESLPAKFKAFGFTTKECDGHDAEALDACLKDLMRTAGQPTAIVDRTIKGYGVSFMANDSQWHSRRLAEDDYAKELRELS